MKSAIWAVSLGSDTSGGVLAPLLMMGGALGGLSALFLPNLGAGFWPLLAMGAILGGTMRAPFTGVVFSIELTHDLNMLLPLLLACVISHAFTVLTLRRSILTERVARRGFHLSREYSVDPLEILFVREVMRPNVLAIRASSSVADLPSWLHSKGSHTRQRLYPVLDDHQRLSGVITNRDLQRILQCSDGVSISEITRHGPQVAYPDEPLRALVYRMADTGLIQFPVISSSREVLGMVALEDLLLARTRKLEAERLRERILRLKILRSNVSKARKAA